MEEFLFSISFPMNHVVPWLPSSEGPEEFCEGSKAMKGVGLSKETGGSTVQPVEIWFVASSLPSIFE